MSNIDTYDREYRRGMTRSMFQSLFWHVLTVRKKEIGLTLNGLAERLGINKSYVSRSFSSPPNWQIDKLSDMAEALDVDLVIEARDRKTGRIFTAHGDEQFGKTTTNKAEGSRPPVTTNGGRAKVISA